MRIAFMPGDRSAAAIAAVIMAARLAFARVATLA